VHIFFRKQGYVYYFFYKKTSTSRGQKPFKEYHPRVGFLFIKKTFFSKNKITLLDKKKTNSSQQNSFKDYTILMSMMTN